MADASVKCEGNASSGSTPLTTENEMLSSDEERARNGELFTAIRKGDLKMVTSLLQDGVKINIVDKNNKNNTPLIYAVEKNKKEIVEELLKWNADYLAKNSKGENAMDIAKRLNYQEIVQIMSQQVSIDEQPTDQRKLQQDLICEQYDGHQVRKSKKGPFEYYNRPGTTGGLEGHFYEIDLLILSKLRGDKDTHEFYLALNMNGVGAYDDVVIRYWKGAIEKKSIIIFMQAKHVEDSKKHKITIEKLKNPKNDNGRFYLAKYFSDFLKIREKFDDPTDPIFKGIFNELDVKFIIYTNAILDEKFNKDRINLIEKIDVDDNIFSTKSKDKAFKLNSCEDKNSDLIEMLENFCLQNRIVSLLAKALVSCIRRETHYNNMMSHDIISTYHVFLSKIVINVKKEKLKGHKGVEYREGTINDRFLEMTNEDSLKETLREEILYRYTKDVVFSEKANSEFRDRDKQNDLVRKLAESLKSSERVDDKIIRKLCGSVIILDKDNRKLKFSDQNDLKNKIDNHKSYSFDIPYEIIKQELKERVEKEPIKLHINFGNIDPVKKPENLIKKLIMLFKQYKSQKVIKIDDSMIGHGKTLTIGDIKNIGKLIGSLLIFDQKEKMLRFVNDESLSGEALQFMENLKTAAKSDSLAVDDYRFDIKVKNFPRDSLVIEDDDKANVKEFLSKLEFFVGQPSEVELQKIIKDEMRVSFQLTKDETEDSFLKIRNKALDYWRKEGKKMYLKKDDDFLKDIVRFNIKFDVKEPILLFTGRVEMRQELHRILQDESIKIPRVASIAGLGGTGKSSLVRKYVSEHSDEYNGNIIWINAQNYQTLFESFYRLARDNLQINVKCLEGEQRDIKSIVGDVYAFFANRKSLFIFDNAEKLGMQNDDEGIRNFLPSSNDNKPYVLITSRNQKWGDRKVISLGPFTSDEAARFICTALNINSGSQEKQIKELTEILQYFPLALQQAIAYIKQSDEEIKSLYSDKGFEIDDYLEEYKKKAKALLNFPFPDDSDNQYTKTTFTTWHTTIHKIAGSKKSGKNALEILNVIAYCLPYNIPSKMFLKIEKNTRKLGAAVQLLKKYSMVDLENGELSVHRLVQHVTRINLRDQKREKDTLKKAVKLFHDGSKQIDLFANNLRVSNVDHALSIWSYIDKYKDLVREFCSLPTLIVSQLHADLRFEEAHSFGSNVLKLFKKILGNNDIAVLSIMNKVASVLYDQGKDVDSLNIYRELEKKSYIINNLRGGCMFFEINIGLILDRQGNHAEALEIFEKLKTQAKIDDGRINHNIGMVLANLGRLDESLDMLRVALKKKEEMPDPDYESILNTKSNISAFLQRQGKYEEALEMAWEVYDERKKILGEGHPDTLTTYCNIALVLKYLEKYEEALRISIEVDEKRLELLPNHPRTFEGMLLTAEIFEAQGNYDKALEKVKETYEKRNACPKNVNPFDIFKIWYRLAVALVSSRIYDKALKELYRIHEEKKILKLSDLQILDTDSLISKVLQAQNEGRLEEDKGVTPLHLAAQNGQVNIVNNLLNQGAAVDAIDYEKGVTSLQLAAQNGHVNVVNTLINRGAQVNYKDKMGWMAVHFAARGGHLQVINDLLNQGAAVDAIDYEKGFTPLHIAAQNGQVNIVNTLIDRGADVNSKNKMDSTPLHSAAQEGHLNVILALLNRGAEINVRIIDSGVTPLQLASQNGHVNVVNNLLNQGAAVDAIDYEKGVTSLQLASQNGHVNVVNTLLNRGAQVNYKDKVGWMPVHLAAYGGHLQVITALLNKGAEINVRTIDYGDTPLDLAAERPANDVAQILQLTKDLFTTMENKNLSESDKVNKLKKHIEKGAILGAVNDGFTTLRVAIKYNFEQIVELLLEKGADATKVTPGKGNTALHIAVLKGNKEIVELILKHVSKVVGSNELNKFINTQTTIKGTASIHIAAQNGCLKVVKSLLKYGAIYNIKNKEGKTPIELSSDVDTINLLTLVEKLFESARTGDSEVISKKLKVVKPDEFEAITNACNDESLTLVLFAKANGHTHLASQVSDLVLQLSQMDLRSQDVEPGVSGLEQRVSRMKL